jgi:hypothetical protein
MKKLLPVLLILPFLSCKKQKASSSINQDNPDNFAAHFQIYESFTDGPDVATDTIIKFSATMKFTDTYSEYKWQVGNTEYFSRDLFLRFGEADLLAPIPVSLFAKKKFFVDGSWITKSDTITRLLVVRALAKSSLSNVVHTSLVVTSPFFGKFKGSFTDNATDTFSIIIANHGINPVPSNTTQFWDARIYNLPKGCGGQNQRNNCQPVNEQDVLSYYYAPAVDPGYLGFTVSGGANAPGSCCPQVTMQGKIINAARDSLRINCTIREAGGAVQNKVFLGKKI